mgnify:FL=1
MSAGTAQPNKYKEYPIKSILSWALALIVAAAGLAACGGSDPAPPVKIATSNFTTSVTAANVAAFGGQTFTFPDGVAAFGTTATTSLTLGTRTTPTFNLQIGAGTVTGNMSFGSCIFEVLTSTIGGDAYQVGRKITVNPCTIGIDTAGSAANGQVANASAYIALGNQLSARLNPRDGSSFPISPTGQLSVVIVLASGGVRTFDLGTITLGNATGV